MRVQVRIRCQWLAVLFVALALAVVEPVRLRHAEAQANDPQLWMPWNYRRAPA